MSPTPNLPPLPGYGFPLDYDPAKQSPPKFLFPSALTPSTQTGGLYGRSYGRSTSYQDPARLRPYTLRELDMLLFMDSVTDKKDWQAKIYDKSILKKWRAEATLMDKPDAKKGGNDPKDGGVETEEGQGARDRDGNGSRVAVDEVQEANPHFTKAMFRYCIDELRWKAGLYAESGFITVFNGDIIKSDVAIPEDLQNALKAAVAPLENVPPSKQDWHPGSDQQVLDLVHPSLFPLVYGLSRILPNSITNLNDGIQRCGEGEVIPVPAVDVSLTEGRKKHNAYSTKFQWLPCEVDISGETPKILTYINNLCPKEHVDLYRVVEKIIGRVIPLWNASLSPSQAEDNPRARVYYGYVRYDEDAWGKFTRMHGPKQLEDEDVHEFQSRLDQWEADKKWRFYIQPDVRGFAPPLEEEVGDVDLKRDYSNTGLQIIVKLANVHLTPEKPKYHGGTWHIEGQLNEHICASAIYYYDCENISTSSLAFRQAVDTPDVDYEQNDNDWLDIVFGLKNYEVAVQDVGTIITRQGRVITFPNIFQHKVQPFKLKDPTRPGHRKILALFLVDPNMKIISTANIPCQRRDWWAKTALLNTDAFGGLPTELREQVVENVEEFPIGMDQAKKLREELMEERKKYVIGYQHANFKSWTISLCEH